MSWHEIVERDHDLQNPTSREKIELAGTYFRLAPGMRVLDVASGRGGPALLLAQRFGCRIHGIEWSESFAATARERIAAAGLEALVDVEVGDASTTQLEPESWDVALCIGAASVYESLHWRAAVEEIAAGADETFVMTHHEHVDRHLWRRRRLGWAIFVGRKP